MATDLERLVIALTDWQNNFIALLQQQQSEALAAMMPRVESQPTQARSLVDSRGIGKPDTLTSKMAQSQTDYKVWRIKDVNWVTASMPNMIDVFSHLERNNEEDISDDKYREFLQSTPAVASFSAQLQASSESLRRRAPERGAQHAREPPGRIRVHEATQPAVRPRWSLELEAHPAAPHEHEVGPEHRFAYVS